MNTNHVYHKIMKDVHMNFSQLQSLAALADTGSFTEAAYTVSLTQSAISHALAALESELGVSLFERSRKGVVLPQTYKAMCRQCGDIVQHRLSDDQSKRCGNGHFVAPTIARAELINPRLQPVPGHNMTAAATRPLARRQIRAHNFKLRARMMKKPRAAQ